MTEPTDTPLPLRQRLKAHSGKVVKTVPVPLIGEATLQSLSAREQIEVANGIPEKAENLEAMAHYIAACLIEDGSPIYTAEDVEEVLTLDPRILATLSKEVRDLCGLDIGVKAAAKN